MVSEAMRAGGFAGAAGKIPVRRLRRLGTVLHPWILVAAMGIGLLGISISFAHSRKAVDWAHPGAHPERSDRNEQPRKDRERGPLYARSPEVMSAPRPSVPGEVGPAAIPREIAEVPAPARTPVPPPAAEFEAQRPALIVKLARGPPAGA